MPIGAVRSWAVEPESRISIKAIEKNRDVYVHTALFAILLFIVQLTLERGKKIRLVYVPAANSRRRPYFGRSHKSRSLNLATAQPS